MRFLGVFVPSSSFYFSTRSNDGDLSDALVVEDLFMRVKPTFVIHLAAKVGGLFANMNDKVGFFEENLAINNNIIRMSHKYAVKKLVCVLSTCIYPDETEYPIEPAHSTRVRHTPLMRATPTLSACVLFNVVFIMSSLVQILSVLSLRICMAPTIATHWNRVMSSLL